MIKYYFTIIVLFINIYNFNSYATLDITISEGNIQPTPIAINEFAHSNMVEQDLANKILAVIKADLERCGFFKIISNDKFTEKKVGIKHKPNFAAWQSINTTILLNAVVKQQQKDKFEVSFILWDCHTTKDIAGEIYQMNEKLWRRIAHKIADQVYERVTGNTGYFDTKISYISELANTRVANQKHKIKRLAIMDQDGNNHYNLTDGKTLVLTPRFSPQADKILYLSYANMKPRVYLRDIASGREKILGDFPGMSFAPRFSPNGKKAILSIAKSGATNIFEIDLATMQLKQLTFTQTAINTSPYYSPDGEYIVFNSDRSGSGQLYTLHLTSGELTKISFAEGTYAAPAWSPKGDYIAFTKSIRGQGFFIGVMKPDGSGERIITQGYLVESPTWAPNGRVIMYTKETKPRAGLSGKSSLYTIDITGNNEILINTPHNGSDPEWSKLLD